MELLRWTDWTSIVSPISRASVIVAVSAVVAFAVPGAILTLTGHANVFTLIGLLVLGGCVYAAALWRNRSVLRLLALRALLPGRRRNA